MASLLESYRIDNPEYDNFSDSQLLRGLYDQFYKDDYDNYDEFIKNYAVDPESLETERFGKYTYLTKPPEEEDVGILETIGPSFKKGILGEKTAALGIAAGFQGLIGDEEDQQAYLERARQSELEQAQIIPGYIPSWRDIGGIGDLTRYAIQKFGESSPWMAEAAAGAFTGSRIGAAVGATAGGIGAVPGAFIGGILGATVVLTPKFFGTNILRQDQEHRAGERVDINEFSALMSAPFQAAADSVLYAVLPRTLKMTTPQAGITKKILKGGLIGVPVEAGTEVFQQFIERWQAGGLEFATSAEAVREYEEAAFAGGLLGGVIGGVTGPLSIQNKKALEDISETSRKEQTKLPIKEEEVEDVALTPEEREEQELGIEIGKPIIPEKAEVEPIQKEEVKKLQEQGKEDGKKLFIGAMLTEKIQEITDTQGEQAAREYYKAFSKEFLVTRREKAPAFEVASRKVKFKPKGAQVGQAKYGIDEVATDQFKEGKGFVVRDNTRDGEDSLAFRKKEDAENYIKDKGSPILTKEDVVIPPKPSEGFAWDSDKQKWVDKWEGERGVEELAELTEAEKKVAKVIKDKKTGKETFTAGAINLLDLTSKQRTKLNNYRKQKGFRKDPEKFNFTDLKELKDADIIPKDSRFTANLTPKQKILLKERRTANKDQIWTTNKELGELGVIGGTEIKADVEKQAVESRQEENETYDVGFELHTVEDVEKIRQDGKVYETPRTRYEVVKTLKEKGTDRVVQEKQDSIFEDERYASARIRYLQKQNKLDVDVYAGEPVINSKELQDRAKDNKDKKKLSSIAITIDNIISKISPTTGILYATDKIVAPEGSLGFSTSEETVGDIQGWYDQANDVIYLSLQKLDGMLDSKGNATSKIFELLSHESFHALRRQLANARKKGVFTETETKALDEAFPGGKIENLPDWVKKTLGDKAVSYLKKHYGNRDLSAEEMQAYVFQVWNTQRVYKKRPPVGNIIQRAFNKISQILEKTKRFLQGKGYNTWESIFELAGKGEIGRRGFDFKTKEEAKAFGKERAAAIELAKEVPTEVVEGERVIAPVEAQYSVERTTNYAPTDNALKKDINSNNPIFKPLGFRPSDEAVDMLNTAAKSIIEAKQPNKKGTDRQSIIDRSFREITDFKNKLISEKPEKLNENIVKELTDPMWNAAVAENQGHKFNITGPDTGESITIGRGSELVGKDAKIHKELSDIRIKGKSLFRAIKDTPYPVEKRVEDKKAIEAGKRAAEKLEKAGLTEEQIEARKQEEARRALGIEEEVKPKPKPTRPTLKLPPKFSVAVDMINTPPTIEGTGKFVKGLGKKRILVDNLLDHFENDTRTRNDEKKLDITNEEDFQKIVDQGVAEFEFQMTQPETGKGWYDTDIEESMALLDQYIPELTDYPVYKELMPFVTAISSAGTPVGGDWKVGIKVLKEYIKTGKIPSINPETGNAYTRYPSTRKALEFTDWYIQKNGLENFLKWLDTRTTIKDINAVRMESGVYKVKKPGAMDKEVVGADMFGDKVAPFMRNINGIKGDENVIDVWNSRGFNRKVGDLWQRQKDGSFRLYDGKRKEQGQPRNLQELEIMNRFMREVSDRVGENIRDTQAVLWYFEQGLYTKLGVKSEPTSYADITKEEFKDVPKRGIREVKKPTTEQVQVPTEEKAETRIADNYVKGPDPNLEAQGKESVVDIVPETGVLFSTESLMGNNNDEGIVSLSDAIIDDRVMSGLSRVDKTYVSKLDKLRKRYPKLKFKVWFGGESRHLSEWLIETRMKFQDKGYGTRRMLDAIERKLGMKLTDPEFQDKYGLIDPYIAEELFHGRAGERISDIQTLKVEPILDILEENKIPIGDLDLYLYARHAEERNAVIYEKWKKKEKGFEKVTEEQAKKGSGMTDEQAKAIMSDFESRTDGSWAILEDIGNRVDEMMRTNLETLYDGQMISDEIRKEFLGDPDKGIKPKFEHYVPLRGIDYEIDSEETQWRLGVPVTRTEKKLQVVKPPGFQVRKEGKEAKIGMGGRGVLPENIQEARNTFAQAMIKSHNDVVAAERNRVAISLYNFAKFYKKNVDSNTDGLWTIMEDPTKPDQAATIEEFEKQKNSFNKEKARLKGKWKRKNPGEVFKFLIDGKEKVMLLEDEYLARFFNNIGSESGNWFTNALGKVTRYLAMINTGYNPEFIVANLLRDLQTATINISDEQTVQLRNSMIGNWKNALKGAYRVERNADAKGEWEDKYKDYKRAGGKVGFFTSIKTLENQLDEIQSQLSGLNTEKKSRNALRKGAKFAKGIGKYISDVNAAVENAVRVSAFHAALDAGLTETQAASLAKNLTVNFNRRGEWGSVVNSMYLFFNASVQGSVRVLQASFKSPKIRKILYGITASSFLLDMMNRMVAGEDDDGRNRYDKLSGWVKAHNLILFLPGTDKYVAIPLPYGYNVLAVIGQTMASSMPEEMGGSNNREVSIGQNAARTVGSIFDAFNPVGGAPSVGQFVAPTILKPAVQLWENQDYAGRSIYPPDNPFDGNAGPPDSQRYWNANSLSVGFAQTINSLTGGSAVEKSLLPWLDFSPETVDFWFGHAFGGAGTFAGNATETGLDILNGRWSEMTPNQIPWARRVFKSQPTFVNKQVYFDLRDEVKIAENLVEYHRKEGNKEALQNVRKDRGDLLRLRPMIKGIESQRRKIRQQIKFIEDSKRMTEEQKKERIKKLLDRETMIIQRFIKRADQILA